MNKAALAEAMSAKTGMTKKNCQAALEAMISAVTETVSSGERVTLMGFGTFETRERAPRTARNPRTGERVPLPASRVAVFRPGDAFRGAVEREA